MDRIRNLVLTTGALRRTSESLGLDGLPTLERSRVSSINIHHNGQGEKRIPCLKKKPKVFVCWTDGSDLYLTHNSPNARRQYV